MTERTVHWSALVLRDSDGIEAGRITGTNGVGAAIRGLGEFRQTGSISGLFFDRLGLPHEDDEDASTWGPKSPDDIDWAGFPG